MRLGSLLGPDVYEIVRDDPSSLGEGLREFHPADVADLLDEIPPEYRLRVLEHLDEKQLGEVLSFGSGSVLKVAMTRLQAKKLAKAMDAVEPDDAARLLSFLSEEKRLPVLNEMSARDAAAAKGLLAHGEGSAGRLM